jgi:arylsulfatase A-like enzyme
MKKLLQNKLVKRIIIPAILLIAALLILHVINLSRMKTRVFDESARMLIERSRRIQEVASTEYQAKALAMLPTNQYNGLFFRLDDLLSKAVIREKPSVSDKSYVSDVKLGFEFDDAAKPGLMPAMRKSILQVKNGILRIEHHDPDYLINEAPIQINKDDIGEIVIRARVNKGTQMVISWHRISDADEKKLLYQRTEIDLIDNTSFHTYVINAKSALKRLPLGSEIRKIFLRPSNVDGAVAEIDFIRFVSKKGKYSQQISGVDYEIIGKETRRVLYMLPTQTLEYALRLPDKSPTLDFGTGILIDHEPMDFEISISDGHNPVKIYNYRLTNASEWHDVRLDLSNWAGKRINLSLRVSGSQQNVGFWSNPLIYSDPNKHFNVIIVLEDALRADHLSTYGYKLITSPVKDSLLKESGIIFDKAISQAPWTRASVPALMTSLFPTATGVWHWSDVLGEEYLTLAEIMRSQGYETASFIQNENAGLNAGLHQGFSQHFDMDKIGFDTESMFGDSLDRWLTRHYNQNFFLYIHIQDPHGPYNPPSPFDQWYHELPSGEKPVKRTYLDPKWVDKPTMEGRRRLYDGEILHNDAQLPHFIERLKSLGIYQNTLLIFMSDHGEYLGEYGFWDHLPPGYMPVIHVPLDFVYPARFHKSIRIPQTVQLIDVMPTILELARIDTSNFLLQGDSLVDLIEGRRLPYWENRISVSEEPYEMLKSDPHVIGSLFFNDWQVISSESIWRGAKYLTPILRTEVFNLANKHDYSGTILSFLPDLFINYKFIKVLNELQSSNIAVWKKLNSGGQDETYKLDPDAQKRLKDLGYIK